MWLWYLELYLATLVAFALGAVLALGLVRLVVRRRAEDHAPAEPSPSGTAAPSATTAGAAT